MKKEVSYGKTPNGGDHSEIIYLNDKGEMVDESVATKCRITEYKGNKPIHITYGICNEK